MRKRCSAAMLIVPTVFLACVAESGPAQVVRTALAAADPGKTIKASAFGFDAIDSTRALQAAIDSGAAKVVIDNVGKPWIVDPITLASDQEVFFEKGTEVLARKGSFKGTSDSLFRAHLKRNITLTGYGATLRMRRDDYAGPPYKKGEWRHVLDLRSCSNVRIQGLTLAESGGDGIYLGTAARNVPNKDIHIKDVVCDKNYRQGISVINAENLLVEDCVLSNTAGTAPAAGIDFEPNAAGERLVRCTMRRCVSRNNAGGGYLLAIPGLSAASSPVSLCFERCRSTEDQRAAVLIHTGNTLEKAVRGSIEFSDCVFEGSTGPGILISNKPDGGCRLRFLRCSLLDVATGRRERAPILLTDNNDSTQPVGGVEFADCLIRDHGERKPMTLVEMAGGVGLKGIAGNLVIETGKGRASVTITEKLLADWIPVTALKAIPRMSLSGITLKPILEQSSAKPAAMAFARLRQTARLVLYATQGDEVHFRVRHMPFAKYSGHTIPLVVVSPSGRTIQRVGLPWKEDTEIRFRAPATGVYRVAADPGLNFVQVASSSHPMSLNGEEGPIHFLGTRGEFYFWVPPGTTQFGVRVCGEGLAEGVKAALVDPRGKVVEERDDVAEMRQFEVVRPAGSPGEVWSLRLSKPTRLTMEDHFVDLRGIPPLLSASREGLLGIVKSQ